MFTLQNFLFKGKNFGINVDIEKYNDNYKILTIHGDNMKTYVYKSLMIYEYPSGLKEIRGQKNKDIITEVIPDAVNYINNKCRIGAILKDLKGVDLFVYPNESVIAIIEKWKQEHFRNTGIEL